MPFRSSRPGRHRGPARKAATALAVLALLSTGACAGPTAVGGAPSAHPTPAVPDFEREAELDAAAVLSPLAFAPLAPVVPVIGSDGLRHHTYELTVVNQSPGVATVLSLQALSPAGAAVGAELAGDPLAQVFRINGSEAGDATLPPGGSGTVFVDLAVDPAIPVPEVLEHRVALSYTPPGAVGTTPEPQDITFVGVPVSVLQRRPVVVAPPLRGSNWVVGNGCCSPINAHRGATLAINGSATVAQRFAIDFVQLSETGTAVTGDPARRRSYPAYGEGVYAAAAGTVVGLRDGQPEQKPGALPEGATLQSADGNYVVVDIGDGLFALYAHLRRGSVRPELGDRVEVGTPLGRLGNTGNTDAPHLHFHVMEGPSPLRANGVPFVFDSFEGQGVLTDLESLDRPQPGVVVEVDRGQRSGQHTDQMPLDSDLVRFPGGR